MQKTRAGGSHTQSVTQNFHGTQTTTRQRRGMVHIHRGGQFTAADEGTGVVYTGHSAFWGNFNHGPVFRD